MKTSLTFVAAIALAFGVMSSLDSADAQAGSDTSGVVSGQAQSNEPSTGAGSVQLPSPNSEDQGGTGIKGSAQGEGATNKDTAPRDSIPR
jgi:hypothetical protein